MIAGAGLKWSDQILEECAVFGFRKEIRMPLPSEALPGRSSALAIDELIAAAELSRDGQMNRVFGQA